MHRTRVHNWSSSKVAKWVRSLVKIDKPAVATFDEWAVWKEKTKYAHKFVYWFTEEFLNKVQDWVCFPVDVINNVRSYFVNRFIDRIHYLPTGLKPGSYHDVDERILHGLFETLVDFIETEKAHMITWRDDANKYKVPWWYKFRITRWGRWRSAEAGLDHLKWEMSLVWKEEEVGDNEQLLGQPTYQAISAKEQYELYNWWKNVRPNRPDPYDASGWTDYCNQKFEFGIRHKTAEEQEQTREMLKTLRELEHKYEQEDEEMMIRLIKIRGSLWT